MDDSMDSERLTGEVSKKRGRPRVEDGRQLSDLSRCPKWLPRRAQAILLSENAPGPFTRVVIPDRLRTLAQGWPDHWGDREGFALAVTLVLPPVPGSPRWLRREGRVEDAEIAELHEQLEIAVRRVRRLEARRRALMLERVARILQHQDPSLVRTRPPPDPATGSKVG